MRIKLCELVPWDKNPKDIEPTEFEALRKSVREHPETVRVYVDGRDNKTILGGNQTYKALQAEGWEDVEVCVADIKSDQDAVELAIKLNMQYGHWVKGELLALVGQYPEIQLGELKLDLKPVSLELMSERQADVEKAAEIKEDEAPKVEVNTLSKLGDLYELNDHKILCGDSTDIEAFTKLMGDERANAVFTDPPYNVDYTGKTKKALKIKGDKMDDGSFLQFLKDVFVNIATHTLAGGAIYVCHADLEGLNFRTAFKEAGFLLKACLIWNKNTMTLGRGDYQWKHEPILYGWKEGDTHTWSGTRNEVTVWDMERPSRSEEHPTMKPIALVARALANSSISGATILDPFMGSGSTLMACEQMDRICRGIELDPSYVDVIIRRWLNYMIKEGKQITIKLNGRHIEPERFTTATAGQKVEA